MVSPARLGERLVYDACDVLGGITSLLNASCRVTSFAVEYGERFRFHAVALFLSFPESMIEPAIRQMNMAMP